MNITIVINARVTDETDLNALRQRIADQVRKLSNPVRTDEGMTTVQSVKIVGSSIPDLQMTIADLRELT